MAGMGKIKLFLDTNVVIDFLLRREGFYDNSAIIFDLCLKGQVGISMSSLTIINCAYILRKAFDRLNIENNIEWLCKTFYVTAIDDRTIEEAIKLHTTDLEDAAQYVSSLQYKPDIIITRDKTGFNDFSVPVMTPTEFVNKCKQ